jgi:hypothetical protein
MRDHGVEVVTSQLLSDTRWNIKLRNLSLNRVFDFVTQRVGARCLYQDSYLVIFRSPTELNTSYQKALEHKLALEQQIPTERRRFLAHYKTSPRDYRPW